MNSRKVREILVNIIQLRDLQSAIHYGRHIPFLRRLVACSIVRMLELKSVIIVRSRGWSPKAISSSFGEGNQSSNQGLNRSVRELGRY